mmetsp:Transcript_57074/g.124881  ORF Transcript_57074/g.124881 Transcript_57074/m.124881 type:complete len:624 (+) Transcript_57074:137-2008(+)
MSKSDLGKGPVGAWVETDTCTSVMPKLVRTGSDYKLDADSSFGVTWKDLNYTVNTKKGPRTILSKASGQCLPGQMMALMGPSGCGKTTLLDLLADRVQSGTMSGSILLGNEPRKSDSARKIVGYVASDDALLSAFTVRETLRYTSRFVLCNKTHQQREARIQSVLEVMGLEICADARVGDPIIKGISAGQKRRLSIGLEILARSPVVMLDEPTSGLDAVAAFQVVSLLKCLTGKGHTIMLSIHQPSSQTFDLFDVFGLMARGRQVYLGPNRDTALKYFSQLGHQCPAFSNPADFYLEMVNTDFGATIRDEDVVAMADAYLTSDIAKKMQAAEAPRTDAAAYAKTVQTAGVFWQFAILLRRMLHMAWKNPFIWAVRVVMYVLLSLMVGTMYEGVGDRSESDAASCVFGSTEMIATQSLLPCLFYVAAFLVFMSIAVLPFFLEIRDVFRRERANGLITCAPYVVADFIANVPALALIAFLSSLLVIFIAGMNNFWSFFLNLFLALTVAESLMRFIGAGQPHYILGMALGAGMFGMFMLTEGFMVPYPDIPKYWLWGYWIGFHTYNFEWFMYNQFKDAKPCGEYILAQYDMLDVDVTRDIIVLVGFALFFQILFFCALYFLHTGRR